MDLEDEMEVLAHLLLSLRDDEGGEYVGDEEIIGPKWVNVPVDTEGFRVMGDPAFQLHFRMNRGTFQELYEVIRELIMANRLLQRERIPLDLMIMHALWILATPDSFRSVAMQFCTSKSTIHHHYVRIISVLSDLAPRFIKWPSRDERRSIANSFEHYSGVPGVIGCVDGTYVVITAPTIQPRRYIDRHHLFSINVQVVCDHNLLIRDLHVGEAGGMNDARVFRRSPLSRKLLMDPETLDPNQHLVGDGAYMLTDKLLIPFPNNGYLTREQRRYNYRLSKCRTRVEHCFGKLFSQWRRLKFLNCFDFEFAVETIVACCVLHNFMILSGYEQPEAMFDDAPPENEPVDFEEDGDAPEQLLEGEFDQLPEEFLLRHPIIRLLQQAKVAGRQKRDEVVAYLQNLQEDN